MNKGICCIVTAGLTLGANLLVAQVQNQIPQPEKITIDLHKKGPRVAPSMYGVFFEEINHSGDGGLYAELVQNRSFEEEELPAGFRVDGNMLIPPAVNNHLTGQPNQIAPEKLRRNKAPLIAWLLESKNPAAASMKLSKERPYFPKAPTNMEVTVTEPSQEVSLVNVGYWGMGLTAKGKYRLRTIFRVSPEYKGTIEARLISSSGTTLASYPIKITKRGEWIDTKGTLISKAQDSKAKLALVLNSPGKVWFDYVSLFPEATFKGRSNGLRNDVAQIIADLKPAFVRWPGGSIVGGITLDTRFKWKETLGDPAARSGQYFTWGYRCTYGMGYYEMLQYCEDIGADAMFVGSAGLGDQYRMADASPENEIEAYIQETFDAIEYALGSTSTTWGARRAADGHPAPFPLKYVEVGNEHWGKEYDRRFAIFYKAIKERYPKIQVIYDAMMSKDNTAESVKADIIDAHFYQSVNGFYSRNGVFDKHPRGHYEVYVGEYATNSGVGSGNMAAALSEAAFIAGMERNGDLVTMTSYAPLLENVNDRRWAVNLIHLNSDQVFGRSSYYVQKLASLNRPTYNVWSDFTQTRGASSVVVDGASGRGNNVPLQFLNAGYDETSGELILKIVNGSEMPFSVSFQLDGVSQIKSAGKVITLSAKSDKDENSMDQPRKIYPTEIAFGQFAKQFSYQFQPFSYTILRVKAKLSVPGN